MIRRGYTKYPLFPKGNHCPAAAKVFNTTTEDYRVGHRPWLTYINPTHASLKFSSAILFAKEYHRFVWRSLLPFLLQNNVILWILFPIRINSVHFIQDYTTHNFTVLSSRPCLCPTENGTACFYLRVCQVTDGASMGPRDVITMVYRGFTQPNLQAGTAFNHEASTQSWTSVTWVPCDPFSPSSPS